MRKLMELLFVHCLVDLMYGEMEGALKEEWFFVLEINLHYQLNKPVKDKNYLRRMCVPMLNMRERVSIFS